VPKIVAHHGPVKVLIAGEGPRKDFLKYKARAVGIENLVNFVGYVDDEARNKLFKVADVAVFPSLYEPFGIVALEAMAAGTPVVVSDSGGLGEIVQHGVNGLKAYVGSADSVADNILTLFNKKGMGEKLREKAFNDIRETYSWSAIARETSGVYREVISQYHKSSWDEKEIRPENVYDRIKSMGRYSIFNNSTQ
jgi:glycogen(starch) synthase